MNRLVLTHYRRPWLLTSISARKNQIRMQKITALRFESSWNKGVFCLLDSPGLEELYTVRPDQRSYVLHNMNVRSGHTDFCSSKLRVYLQSVQTVRKTALVRRPTHEEGN